MQGQKQVQQRGCIKEQLRRQSQPVQRKIEQHEVRGKQSDQEERHHPAHDLVRPQLKRRPGKLPGLEQV